MVTATPLTMDLTNTNPNHLIETHVSSGCISLTASAYLTDSTDQKHIPQRCRSSLAAFPASAMRLSPRHSHRCRSAVRAAPRPGTAAQLLSSFSATKIPSWARPGEGGAERQGRGERSGQDSPCPAAPGGDALHSRGGVGTAARPRPRPRAREPRGRRTAGQVTQRILTCTGGPATPESCAQALVLTAPTAGLPTALR